MLKSFIMTLVISSAASALIEGFLPDGGMKKYVKYLLSLIVLVILLSPLPRILQKITSVDMQTDAFSYDSVEVYARANSIVARRIESSVSEKFGLSGNDIDVRYSDGSITVTAVRRFGLFEDDIRLYILSNFGIDAEVSFIE